ncbi:kinase-like domain-containing protein, partial [Dimargaris cristalligena]
LGRGVHGRVRLAVDITTGQRYAIKIIDKWQGGGVRRLSARWNQSPLGRQPSVEKIRKEIAILKKCQHPNVVHLYEVIDDPAARKIYLVLEYLERGEIQWRDAQERPLLGLDEIRRIFRDLVLGVEYLHYQGIIHRDIKPANLLRAQDGTVKISDFGVSHFSQQPTELAKTVGSPAFFAPELCCTAPELNKLLKDYQGITKAIDVWAMGVTLYCLIYGRCPFVADNEFELFQVIPRQDPLYDIDGDDDSDD